MSLSFLQIPAIENGGGSVVVKRNRLCYIPDKVKLTGSRFVGE